MTGYKIEIDRDTCVGDGLCCEEAPGTFQKDDEIKSVVIDPQGDPPDDILSAAQNCRLGAITLYDADTGEKLWPT
ncbi:MAG: ferredoxin [Planctomycetota bacterium]